MSPPPNSVSDYTFTSILTISYHFFFLQFQQDHQLLEKAREAKKQLTRFGSVVESSPSKSEKDKFKLVNFFRTPSKCSEQSSFNLEDLGMGERVSEKADKNIPASDLEVSMQKIELFIDKLEGEMGEIHNAVLDNNRDISCLLERQSEELREVRKR